MQKKVFRLSKTIMLGTIFALAFSFVLFVSFGIMVLATDMYEEKSVIVFVVFLLCAIMTIVLLLLFKFTGLFTPISITDEGISTKKEVLPWSEIKITGYKSTSKGSAAYFLCIDREYHNDAKSITKRIQQGFCVLLNENNMREIVPIILENITSKVVFFNFDAATELPLETFELLAAHNNRIES